MSDFQNEQDEFYSYVDEELSFLSQAREQMRSYNEMFSANTMEDRFVQSITPPDPMEELFSPIGEEEPIPESVQAEPPQRSTKRKKRGAGRVKKAFLKLYDQAAALWHKQSKKSRIIICSVTAVLLLALVLFIPWAVGEKEPTIRRGVTIDGVSVAGMTRQEAIDTLSRQLDEKVAGTCIIVTFAGDSWTLDAETLGLYHDLTFVVDQALSLDRPNRLIDYLTDFVKKKKEARALETSIVASEVLLRTALAQECGIVDETVMEGAVTFDPTAASEAGLFTITAPRSGRTIDFTRLVADIRVAAKEGGVQQIAVRQITTSPSHTLSELKLSVSCVSQVTMEFSNCSTAELSNIANALQHINGVSIPAGQKLSFNAYAAPYSGENGYSLQQNEAGEYEACGINGAATLLYRAGLLCDMKLLTRFAPKTPLEAGAIGLDAAVSASQDLVLKNESDYPIYICASLSGTTATVTVYGMPLQDDVRVQVETQLISCQTTPEPNVIVNDGSYTLTDGQSLDVVLSTPACTVRTWRIYYDKFERELYREQIGTDSTYEEVIGTRVVAAQ